VRGAGSDPRPYRDRWLGRQLSFANVGRWPASAVRGRQLQSIETMSDRFTPSRWGNRAPVGDTDQTVNLRPSSRSTPKFSGGDANVANYQNDPLLDHLVSTLQ
jgi:hypothetical protein